MMQRLSYSLDEGMLEAIGKEFSPEKITSRFVEALTSRSKSEIDKSGKKIFGEYGSVWGKRTLELGEKYTDATYEALKDVIARTNTLRFPMVPQRFVEIAYLSVMSFLSLKVVENSSRRLAYRLKECDIYNSLKERAGADVASLLPCRYGCLTALETIFRDLDIPAKVEMEGDMPSEGYCQFAATRL